MNEALSDQHQRFLSPLQAARKYLSLGWQPIPIPPVNGQPTKGPTCEGWSELILREDELLEHFAASVNIGLLLGAPSRGLIDVDIDSVEALLIAPALLPSTNLISGRSGNPRSHWWYIVDDSTIRTTKFHYTLKGDKDVTLIELRGTGGQTVVPPSFHPEGDRYEWHEWGEPSHVTAAALLRVVKKIAIGALLARFWPSQGARHDAALPIAGLFLSAGWPEEEAAELVFLAAQAAGHKNPSDRKIAVHDTYRKAATGQRTQGIPKLKDYMPEEIVTTLAKWANDIFPHPSRPLTVAESPWPEPEALPNRQLPVPPLDEVMIPAPFRPWLVDIAERIQCPLEFPTIGAIVSLASLVGRKIGIRPKRRDDWLVIPNLWGAVIGRPGIMKSPALAEVLKPLQRLEVQARAQYDEALRKWEFQKLVQKAKRETLEKRIKEAVKKGEDPASVAPSDLTDEDMPPVPVRYIVNDATVEKLGEILNQNPRGVLHFRDELTGWFRTLEREGHQNDRAFYLESWNGNGSYTYDRIGRGTLYIAAACVSIVGGIQPGPLTDYLRATVRGGAGDDGLMQRFQLAVYPDDVSSWRNVDRWPDVAAKQRASCSS